MTTPGTIAGLQRLTMHELRVPYAELFGETTAAKNRTWLLRRVAWRLQALAEGDLSERARQRAAELASDADLRTTVPRVKTSPQGDLPGSTCPGRDELTKDADQRISMPRLELPGHHRLPHGEQDLFRDRFAELELDGEGKHTALPEVVQMRRQANSANDYSGRDL